MSRSNKITDTEGISSMENREKMVKLRKKEFLYINTRGNLIQRRWDKKINVKAICYQDFLPSKLKNNHIKIENKTNTLTHIQTRDASKASLKVSNCQQQRKLQNVDELINKTQCNIRNWEIKK